MAVKFKGKDFSKLTKKEIQEWLETKVYMKPTKTFKLKNGKYVLVKRRSKK